MKIFKLVLMAVLLVAVEAWLQDSDFYKHASHHQQMTGTVVVGVITVAVFLAVLVLVRLARPRQPAQRSASGFTTTRSR